MKLKYYLRGLGLGILVTSVILSISFYTHKNTISDEEIIKRAKKIGMIMPETEDVVSDTEDIVSDTEELLPDTGSMSTQESVPDELISQENPNVAIVQVYEGEVCRQIAEDLMEKGLITDVEDFRKYMDRQNYDSSIRQGTYEIPYGATYEQIAEILTKKNE